MHSRHMLGLLNMKFHNNSLYDNEGQKLKELHCPVEPSVRKLEPKTNHIDVCRNCSKEVVNVENVEEFELINLIKDNPEICVKINRFDPRIEFVKTI